MTAQPDNTIDSVDAWFDEIFKKSVAVDLREITGKNGHQPESTMYLWQLKEAIEHKIAQEANKAQTNGVAWTIGVIDQLHDYETNESGEIDRRYKGIKNTIRDRYKAETGVDPAPNYPIKAQLTADKEQAALQNKTNDGGSNGDSNITAH